MECRKCGKNIDENDVFCKYCGNKIEKNVIKPIIIEDEIEPIFKINKPEKEEFVQIEQTLDIPNKSVDEQQIIKEEVLEEKNVQIEESEKMVNHQEETNKAVEKNIDRKKRSFSISTIVIGIVVLVVVAYSCLVIIDVINNNKEEVLPPVNITKTLDNLKYVVPSDFKADSENTNSIHKYIHSEVDGACQLKIVTATSSYYDSVESYLEEYIQTKDYVNISEYSDKLINGINWRTVLLENTNNKVYYYVASDEDNIYRVELTVTNNEVEYCKNIHSSLLDSLRFK